MDAVSYLTRDIDSRPYMMIKPTLFFCLALGFYFTAHSQAKPIADAYYDFKVAKSIKEDSAKTLIVILELLKREKELAPGQIANLEYHAGGTYEDMGQPDSAIAHYENSLKAEPNYFVIHRALGFIYLEKSKTLVAKMNEANKNKDSTGNAKAFLEYKALVKKAIPYLEKYQACDADDDTLEIITNLYKSIKETDGIATLPGRLKSLGVTCVSLLED